MLDSIEFGPNKIFFIKRLDLMSGYFRGLNGVILLTIRSKTTV
jgi:hypothetical protein